MQIVHQAIGAKEDKFEKPQRDKREVICACGDSSMKKDDNYM